ncbi:unnamed protein product [Cylicocyclus nassatus]|uniref:Uncharacterized protein n=1 Tax=Cylicocyclus nassatus TaxID=53992 RepID=A0AA36DIQ4_CYLNA|nr:unnamed protein product [Cylicocyclus nassatus]
MPSCPQPSSRSERARNSVSLVDCDLPASGCAPPRSDVTIRQLRDTIAKLEEDKAREVEQAISEVEIELRDEFSVRDHETTMRSDKLKAENAVLKKRAFLEAELTRITDELAEARTCACPWLCGSAPAAWTLLVGISCLFKWKT